MLTEQDLAYIIDDSYVTVDYFYIPIFYTSDPVSKDFFPTCKWFTLRYDKTDTPETLIHYASKVPAKTTLLDSIQRDLLSDFNYPKSASFRIAADDDFLAYKTKEDTIKLYDTAFTKDGVELSRLLVLVEVDMFDTSMIHPIGSSPFWNLEGVDDMNLAYLYYLGLLGVDITGKITTNTYDVHNQARISAQF